MNISGFHGPDAFWDQTNKLAEGLRRSFEPGSVFGLADDGVADRRVAIADWQFENGPRAIQYSDDSGVRFIVATVPDEQQARFRVQSARSEVFPPEHLSDDELDSMATGVVTITIEESPVRVTTWSTITGEVGFGAVDAVWVVAESRGSTLAGVALERVADIEPAIRGWLATIREARGGR